MQQTIVFIVLAATIALFLWDRIRYDLVALIALFSVVLFRVVQPEAAFAGFAHPAVITVVAVMIISKGMQNSGVIDLIAHRLLGLGGNIVVLIMALSVLTAVASAFMNNVGALAIMLPIAIQLARKSGHSPSHILMPLSFASLMGGMMTLVGTPPNIIIASFRAETEGSPFAMLDFLPAGAGVTLAGILFIALLGWRLLPVRKNRKSTDTFQIEDYITEVRIVRDSKLAGATLRTMMEEKGYEINVIGLIRNKLRIHIPDPDEELKVNDIMILEADAENLKVFLDRTRVKLLGGRQFRKDAVGSRDISIREVVVLQDSKLIGKSAAALTLRSRYGINLLAIARGERKFTKRISQSTFRVGDVLLIQGRTHMMDEVIANIGCMPLQERGYRIGDESRTALTLGIFGAAIVAVIFNLIAVQIAFAMAALLLVLSRVISFREVYQSVDWSVIVLLGAMIPVGLALEDSGGADLLAGLLLKIGKGFPLWVAMVLIMTITMLLSNVINNAATAVLMAPIGIHLAQGLNASTDPFLMAIAIAASAAFLTPIGHQSNTLVLGPGGYKFGDYWKMGLPLQCLVMVVAIPILIQVWG